MPDTDTLPEALSLAAEQALLDERARLVGEMDENNKRGDDFDTEKHERLAAEIDKLTLRIDGAQRVRNANTKRAEKDALTLDGIAKDARDKDHDKLFDKYVRQGFKYMSGDELDALMRFTDKEIEQRLQTTLTGAQGGFLVPDSFLNRLVEAQDDFGSIEPYVNVITTSTGNDISWLSVDETGQEGELLMEGDEVSEHEIEFTNRVLRAYTYSSKLVKVSWQLLQDSVIDIEGLLTRLAGQRLARIHTRHFTTGTGVNQPLGLVTGAAGAGETLASATTIDYNDLINIQHAINTAYRSGNQRWMFNDATLKLVRNVLDGQGNRAWEPSLRAGIPDTVLGDPYIINAAMPTPATGARSILYGDFNRGYVVRRVRGATLVRQDELYSSRLQSGFFVYDRMDGKPDETNAYTFGVHP